MLSLLPSEILYNIFIKLDCKSFCLLSQTSRQFHKIGSDNQLWKQMCLRDYICDKTEEDLLENKVPLSQINWKSYYIEKYNSGEDSLVWVGRKNIDRKNWIGQRYSHSVNLSPDKRQLIVIGGEMSTTNRYADAIAIDVETLEIDYRVNLSTKISRHQSCLYNNKIYVFGGYDGVLHFNEMSSFNLKNRKWESVKIDGPSPQPRSNHACVIVGDYMYLFGGNNRDANGMYQILGDFHKLDLKEMKWYDMSNKVKGKLPRPRSGHRFVAFENKIFMFGGGCWNGVEEKWTEKFNDIQVYDVKLNEWYSPRVTGEIDVCTFSSCVRLGFQLAVFGGQSLHSAWTKSTLFTLDTITFEWKKWKMKDRNCRPLTKDMASLTLINDHYAYLIGGNHGGPTDDVDVLYIKWNANSNLYIDKNHNNDYVSKGEP